MADNKVTIEFELLSNVSKKIDEITNSVSGLQNTVKKDSERLNSSFDSAFSIFTKGAVLIGGIKAVESALDQLFEAEKVAAVNAQFELFTKNAKVSTETLRSGLVNAADGLADDTDLLKVANKALIDLGVSAAKLPEILGLARQVTASFGGDLTENFEKVTNAIATGQVKTLKQMGLIIDLDKAHKDYANTLGVESSKLSDSAKQTALLNAVLEKGKTAFAGLDTNTNQVGLSFQRAKVALAQFGETAAIALNKVAGPAVASSFNVLSGIINELSVRLKAQMGDSASQVEIKMKALDDAMKNLGRTTDSLPTAFSMFQESSENSKDTIEELRLQMSLLEETERKRNSQLSQSAQIAKEAEAAEIANTAAKEKARIASEEAAEAEKKLSVERAAAVQQSLTENITARQELLDAQHENELISDEEFYAAKTQAENDRYTQELIATQDKFNKKKIDQETYNRDIETANQKHYTNNQKLQQQANKSSLQDQTNFLNTAATLQNAKTKELQLIGKAAAITSIAIQTPPAIGGAIRFGNEIGGPVVGAVFAAITAAAMAAQASQIAGVALATGIDSVPGTGNKDNFPAILAPGERVVPKTTNVDLKNFLSGSSGMTELLQSIDNKLSQLQNQTIVNIGAKNIVNELRDAMAGGRVINV